MGLTSAGGQERTSAQSECYPEQQRFIGCHRLPWGSACSTSSCWGTRVDDIAAEVATFKMRTCRGRNHWEPVPRFG